MLLFLKKHDKIAFSVADTAQRLSYQLSDVAGNHQSFCKTIMVKIESRVDGSVDDVTISNVASKMQSLIEQNDFITFQSIIAFTSSNVTRKLMNYVSVKEEK